MEIESGRHQPASVDKRGHKGQKHHLFLPLYVLPEGPVLLRAGGERADGPTSRLDRAEALKIPWHETEKR